MAGIWRLGLWSLLAVLAGAAPGSAAEQAVLADEANCLAKPNQVLQIGSPVFGIIAAIAVDRGHAVTRGQVLASLESTVEEAQLALDQQRATNTTAIDAAKVDLAWFQRELGRRRQIAGNMFSKANEIDEYVTKVDQALIAIKRAEADRRIVELEAMRSQRQLQLRSIKSPVNGVVTDIKLRPGEFIYEQNPMMVVAQIDPLAIDLVLSAQRYRSVSVGMSTIVRFSAPVESERAGVIDAIDPIIDAASDTFRVRMIVENPDNQIPAGVRCSVRLAGQSKIVTQ